MRISDWSSDVCSSDLVDSDGQLVTSSGYRVQPETTLPANAQSVTIGSDGVVSVTIAGQAAAQQVVPLHLTDFIHPSCFQTRGYKQIGRASCRKRVWSYS